MEGLQSDGRKKVFLVPLTLGGSNGRNFLGLGKAVETLVMLVLGRLRL